MKVPARLWKRLEALERPGPGPDDEINAILRKYRGMKALRLAIEKARELEGRTEERGKTKTPSKTPSG